MSDLSVKYKNLIFPNPFILASSPITRNAEMILRGFKAGWAGAVTKTIVLDHESIINVSPRLCGFKTKNNLYGLNNIELISERPLEVWLEEIRLIKSEYPDRILIASIMAEAYNLQGWQKLAKEVQQAGADIIELNLSCPHGMPERGMGSFCSELPQVCADITKSVKEISTIPVWAKLSPNVTDISYLAQLCIEAGADGIAAINTVKGFSGIDVETFEPKLNVVGQSAYGGFSGQIIKPIALKAVSDIAINNNTFISGLGGISSWQDVAEFMLLGSSTVQICTEVMFKGYDIIANLLNGLNDYLCRHEFNSVENIVGNALPKISSFEQLDKKIQAKACINHGECISCSRCFSACKDGGYQAIEFLSGNPVINVDKCAGCGLCSIICPVNCIEINSTVNSQVS